MYLEVGTASVRCKTCSNLVIVEEYNIPYAQKFINFTNVFF